MNFLLMFNSRQTLGELACCWITSKAGVNSDFVFILKRITDRFVFSLSTRIREKTEELNSKCNKGDATITEGKQISVKYHETSAVLRSATGD